MKKIIEILFLLVFLTRFFDFILINKPSIIILDFFLLLFFLCNAYRNRSDYRNYIFVFSLLVLGSIFYSNIIHGQNFIQVLIRSYFAFGFLSFFIPFYYKLSFNKCLNVIIVFSCLFCFCYILQYLLYPIEIFQGSKDVISINESQFRMRMPCSICAYLLIFWGIEDFLSRKHFYSIFVSVLGFLPVIIMGFRSLVFLTIVFSIYILLHSFKKRKKHLLIKIFAVTITVVAISQLPIVHVKIEEMQSRQERGGFFENDDYKRVMSLDYYSNVVYTSFGERVFGGGVPLVNMESLHSNNKYANKVSLAYQYKLYWNDLGIIGLGFIIGFPAVLMMSFIILLTSFRCNNRRLLFIRCTLLSTFLGSIFTSQEIYRSGNFIIIGFLLYLEYIFHKEEKVMSSLRFKGNE